MGNQSSLEEQHEFKIITTNYAYERKYNDSRFGEVKLLVEKNTGVQVFQKDITTNSKNEYEEYIKEIKKRATFQHPNILKLLGFTSKREDMFCADFFKVSLFIESFEQDLEQEIYTRKEKKQYFDEVELWYIFDSIVSVLAFLQEHKIYHGDVRPFNIFVTAAKDYKVCDPALFRGTGPAWFLDALEAKSHYPSPQFFKALATDAKSADYDRAKNDVFGLGMTMLEIAHLQKPDDVYNWDSYTVNSARVEDLLTKLKGKYSDTLIQTLRFTLNFNEAERPDFVTLDRELAPYRSDIRARISTTQPSSQIPERLSVPAEDELEKRVRAALRKSEETISRSSPSKYHNKFLDPYIHSYLANEPIVQEKPLLQSISPYLSAENKYSMTLTQYPAEETGEPLRRSQFAGEERKDLPQTTSVYGYQPQTDVNTGAGTYGGASYQPYTSTTGYGGATYGTSQYGTTSYEPAGTKKSQDLTGYQPTGTTYQPYTGTADYGTTGTTGANYGTTSYGGNYGTTGTYGTTGVTGNVGGTGTTPTYTSSYQPTGTFGTATANTNDILKQVEETLKRSQSLAQPQ